MSEEIKIEEEFFEKPKKKKKDLSKVDAYSRKQCNKMQKEMNNYNLNKKHKETMNILNLRIVKAMNKGKVKIMIPENQIDSKLKAYYRGAKSIFIEKFIPKKIFCGVVMDKKAKKGYGHYIMTWTKDQNKLAFITEFTKKKNKYTINRI